MENNDLDKRIDKLKHLFNLRRTRITLYIVAVLWLAVAAQVVVNKVFQQDIQITEAFVKSDTQEMQSSLEVAADYKTGSLSDAEKKDLIRKIAASIDLKIDGEISASTDDKRDEAYYYKQAKQASTEIEIVGMKQEDKQNTDEIKNYIIVRLHIYKGIQSIEKYKHILEETLNNMGVKDKQITLKYEGNRDGNLTSKQKHEIATQLVKDLQGEVAYEYDEGDIYTVYGYTGMINEYVSTLGNKINLQVAITYNELTNKTKITLATPMLNESW